MHDFNKGLLTFAVLFLFYDEPEGQHK